MLQQSSNFSRLNELAIWIRKTKIGDIPSIYRIESQSFKDPYSPLLLMNLLSLYSYGFFVAEIGKEIVGYMLVRIIGQKAHIIALATDERYRNIGIGTRLLDNAFEVARNRNANGLWLEVRASNLEAQRFYLKTGFERLKTVTAYYGDGEDAEILYLPTSS
jgi:ribosomal-protein-alanine N-acetyltransferase